MEQPPASVGPPSASVGRLVDSGSMEERQNPSIDRPREKREMTRKAKFYAGSASVSSIITCFSTLVVVLMSGRNTHGKSNSHEASYKIFIGLAVGFGILTLVLVLLLLNYYNKFACLCPKKEGTGQSETQATGEA